MQWEPFHLTQVPFNIEPDTEDVIWPNFGYDLHYRIDLVFDKILILVKGNAVLQPKWQTVRIKKIIMDNTGLTPFVHTQSEMPLQAIVS